MKATVVRYRVKAGRGDENQQLVEAVFEELNRTRPAGLRYGTIRLDDGVTFYHIARVSADPNPLTNLPAFKRFQEGIRERCDEPPAPVQGTVIGNFQLYES